MQVIDDGNLSAENVRSIAQKLKVTEDEVVTMNSRLSSADYSLNMPLHAATEGEWQDWLVDETETQEIKLAEQQEVERRKQLLNQAVQILTDREYYVLSQRRLREEPIRTLENLSQELGISRERVRQIEMKALSKVQEFIRQAITTPEYNDLVD